MHVTDIMPLKWELNAEGQSFADVFFGRYHVQRNPTDRWCWGLSFYGEFGVGLYQTDNFEAAKASCQADYERRILSALVPSTPAESRCEELVKAEAFDRIVAARKKHVDAVAAYNARLELANAERMRGSWAIKLDDEYRAMSDAQTEFHRTVQDLADAALKELGKGDGR